MKRYRINGQSVVSNFDRDQSSALIANLTEQGLLERSSSDIFSVVAKAPDGRKVIAHVSPWEVALVRLPQIMS